jgi:hypothetical protein
MKGERRPGSAHEKTPQGFAIVVLSEQLRRLACVSAGLRCRLLKSSREALHGIALLTDDKAAQEALQRV